jgi:hypothetical protein
MKEVFTLREWPFWIGLLGSFGHLAWLTIMVTMLFRSDGPFPPNSSPIVKGILGAIAIILPSLFLAASIWVLLAFYRESITLEDTLVHFTGVLFDSTIPLTDVSRARWRWSRHPSLKLRSPKGTETIWFGNFRGDEPRRLILYFRERVSPSVQEGWTEEFLHYGNEVEKKESPAEVDRRFRSDIKQLWIATAYAIPVVFILCGGFLAFITWFAERNGVMEIPSWTGSLALDYTLLGSAVLAVFPVVFSFLLFMGKRICGTGL